MHYPDQADKVEEILASDAVQLFLDGVKRIKPEFDPQPGKLVHIRNVCHQVQGMPLGILLASCWVASMELDEIEAEIECSLDFLSGDWTDVPDRQRSLRATFDHSWTLLSPHEQAIFKNLSVFRGGFNRKAARVVAGASAHELRLLVDKSLLARNSSSRYEIHELPRQYSAEKQAALEEDEITIREKHAMYFCDALVAWGQSLKSPRQEYALQEMDKEIENIRAVWNWATGQGILPLLNRMVEAVCLYYLRRVRYQEGEVACRLALEKLDSSIAETHAFLIRVQIEIWRSHFTRLLGCKELAQSLRVECQAFLEKAASPSLEMRYEQALLSFELGEATQDGNFDDARQHYLHSLSLFEELGQSWWAARAMLNAAICSLQAGDFEAAGTWFEQCLVSLPKHGDRRNLAKALRWRGFLHVRRGELEQAMHSMQEAAAAYRAIDDRANIDDSLSGLGLILTWQGKFQEAAELCTQSLSIYQELGDHYNTAFMNGILGIGLAFMGRYPEAEAHAQTSLAQARQFDFQRIAATSLLILGWVALSLGDIHKALEVLQESMDLCRGVKHLDELGWALAVLRQAHLARGDSRTGLACIREALQIWAQIKATVTICQALGPSAVWIGKQGDPVRAVELYSLARQHLGLENCRWFEDVYGRQVAALSESLTAESVAAAQACGRALDLGETAQALLAKLALGR